jgi:galactokinase
MMRKKLDIESLCDLDPASFDLNQDLINDPVVKKRALHVVSENQRVKDAVIALQTGDMEVFGKLMYASHQSLNDNYEVTGPELNTIVDFCKTFPGCIGARMTGAGFGGCAIALIKESTVIGFQQQLAAHYQSVIGYRPEIFTTTAEDGVNEIRF